MNKTSLARIRQKWNENRNRYVVKNDDEKKEEDIREPRVLNLYSVCIGNDKRYIEREFL